MSVSLRPYQDKIVRNVFHSLNTYRSVLLQCPTGGGKTVMASALMEAFSELDQVVFFICHRKELVHQTSLTLTKYGLEHSFVAAKRPFDPSARIFVCGIDTLKTRLAQLAAAGVRPDVVVWDECHHVGAAGWAAVKAAFDSAYHVGCSATPVRLDGAGLDGFFHHMVMGPTSAWLIQQGYLSQYRAFAPSTPDLSKLKKRGGDYTAEDAAEVMSTPKLIGDAVAHWLLHAKGLRTVGFCATVHHSEMMAAAFNAAGIPAAHLDGNTPDDERSALVQRFADGELQVLFNVALMGEGFDLGAIAGRDVTVDCVILLRPTQSLGLHLQQIGRCLRPSPGKVAIILDHCGNTTRHGLPDDDYLWTLTGTTKAERDAEDSGPPPPVTCEGCYSQVRRPCPDACPYCGEALVAPPVVPKVKAGELREIKRAAKEAEAARKAAEKLAKQAAKEQEKRDAERRAVIRKREEANARTYEELLALALARKAARPAGSDVYEYPAAWARQRMAARGARR